MQVHTLKVMPVQTFMQERRAKKENSINNHTYLLQRIPEHGYKKGQYSFKFTFSIYKSNGQLGFSECKCPLFAIIIEHCVFISQIQGCEHIFQRIVSLVRVE